MAASLPADEFATLSEDMDEGKAPRIIKAHIDLTGMKTKEESKAVINIMQGEAISPHPTFNKSIMRPKD